MRPYSIWLRPTTWFHGIEEDALIQLIQLSVSAFFMPHVYVDGEDEHLDTAKGDGRMEFTMGFT